MLLTRREMILQSAALAASAFCPPAAARLPLGAAQETPGDRSIRDYLAVARRRPRTRVPAGRQNRR